MTILFITEFFPKTAQADIHGGVEARVFFLASLLAKRHTVYVIASREKDKPDRQIINQVNCIRTGATRSYSRTGNIFERIIFSFAAIVTGLKIQCDLVEGSGYFSWFPAFSLARIKRCAGIALVADTVNAYAEDTPRIIFITLRMFEKILLRQKWNLIICISKQVHQKIEKLKINAKTTIIYCGAPIAEIKGFSVKKMKAPTIACVARLVPYKRVHDLIAATSLLKNAHPGLNVHIVGNGELLDSLKQQVREYKLGKMVFFHNFVKNHTDVLKLIKSATIFCLPSTVEGFGIATIEALAAGVPAVITDTPIHKEITKGKGVLYFRPQNSKDLAQKINLLLSNKNLYKKLSSESTKIAQRYDWKKIAFQTEKAYQSLLTN